VSTLEGVLLIVVGVLLILLGRRLALWYEDLFREARPLSRVTPYDDQGLPELFMPRLRRFMATWLGIPIGVLMIGFGVYGLVS
jgi:hypothetical protein